MERESYDSPKHSRNERDERVARVWRAVVERSRSRCVEVVLRGEHAEQPYEVRDSLPPARPQGCPTSGVAASATSSATTANYPVLPPPNTRAPRGTRQSRN